MLPLWIHYSLLAFRQLLNGLSFLFGSLTPSRKRQLPPINNEILLKSATELTTLIKTGQLTSEEVVNTYWKRIQAVNPHINVINDSRIGDALNEAREVDRKVQEALNGIDNGILNKPLLGVPFTCKNSVSIKNMAFDSGSWYRKGVKGDKNAPVIENLRKAGGIPLAITNVPELVLWWDSENKVHGRSNNPYDLSRIVGGSSGGEAALIAAAGSVVGAGSDIGGSIRIPSMCCGVFGHKPTPGVVPIEDMYPSPCLGWLSYLSFGPLCRYSADIIPLVKAMAGEAKDRLHLDSEVDFKKLKFYYILDDGGNPLCSPVDPQIKATIIKAVSYFEETYNVNVEQLKLPELMNSFEFWITAMQSGDCYPLACEMKLRKGRINPWWELVKSMLNLSVHTRSLLTLACLESVSPGEKAAKKIMNKAAQFRTKFVEQLGDNSVLFYPTLPIPAVKHKTTIFNGFNCSYAMIMNILGVPATHCPTGLSKSGIPLGFQIVSAPFNDRYTIAVAKELEKVFGGWVPPSDTHISH